MKNAIKSSAFIHQPFLKKGWTDWRWRDVFVKFVWRFAYTGRLVYAGMEHQAGYKWVSDKLESPQ